MKLAYIINVLHVFLVMTADLSVQYEPPPDCGDGRCWDMFWDSIYIILDHQCFMCIFSDDS